MTSEQTPIKVEVKAGTKRKDVQAQETPREFKVIVPKSRNTSRYSILQFNGPMNIDPSQWPQMEMAMTREDNRAYTIGPSEIIQDYGAGSEYGRAAREEARHKKYGFNKRDYHHDNQPWQMQIKDTSTDQEGKTRHYRSVREGGAGAHSDYWIFMKSGDHFVANKVDDWYRFMPNVQRKGLDIDQAEKEFQNRNKVFNEFALKAKIQQTFKDQIDDEAKASKQSILKIKDEVNSDDESAEEDEHQLEVEVNQQQSKKPTKKKGLKREVKDKKQRVANADEVAAYESEDGEDEGREYDYISDSGSDTSREEMTVDEKVEKALVAVGDESAMRDDASDEEEDDDIISGEAEDEEGKRNRQLLKKLTKNDPSVKSVEKFKLPPIVKKEEVDLSGSDTDDPDNADTHSSVLFLQKKAVKRRASENLNEEAKRLRNDPVEQTPQEKPSVVSQPPAPKQGPTTKITDEIVRRLLAQRSMTTAELFTELKPHAQGMTKEAIIQRLAEVLKSLKIKPVKRKVNNRDVMVFELNKDT